MELFYYVPLSLLGRFSGYSTYFIHSPCQTGSQPMSGRFCFTSIMYFINMHAIEVEYNNNIVYNKHLFILWITGFCSTKASFVLHMHVYIYVLYISHYILPYNAFCGPPKIHFLFMLYMVSIA